MPIMLYIFAMVMALVWLDAVKPHRAISRAKPSS
jgi:hypothetical protein